MVASIFAGQQHRGGGDFLDEQNVTSARTAGGAGVDTTGYSNGTLLIAAQGACETGMSWLGGQIEALACQDGNGLGKRVLIFAVLGTYPDAGWETMTVNGTAFTRADAIYSDFSGLATLWQWAGPGAVGLATDPFHDGADNVVTWA